MNDSESNPAADGDFVPPDRSRPTGSERPALSLTIPLYVHFPGGEQSGERIDQPTEVTGVRRS